MAHNKPEPLLDDKDLAEGDKKLKEFSTQLDFLAIQERARIIVAEKARARERQAEELAEWQSFGQMRDAEVGKK